MKRALFLASLTVSCLASLAIALFCAPSSAQATKYLFEVTAPECSSNNGSDCSAYPSTANGGYINVYNMETGYNLIKTITFKSINPALTDIQSIRGIIANANANLFCLPNYGTTNTLTNTTSARLACFSLSSMNPASTPKLVYDHSYNLAAIDRACFSPDGSTIYAPSGENVTTGPLSTSWYVLNAATGNQTGTINLTTGAVRPHNTWCDSGPYVYMAAVDVPGGAAQHHSVVQYNPSTQAQNAFGDFTEGSGRVRPFTVDPVHNLIYVNIEDWIGFDVVSTAGVHLCGKNSIVCGGNAPPGYVQPGTNSVVNSHGLALLSNGNTLYVAEPNMGAHSSNRTGVEVWDVSKVATGGLPVYKTFIPTSVDSHVYNGKNPGWLYPTNSGAHVITETGEVIDTTTNTVTSKLADPNQTDGAGQYMRTRYMMELDF